MDTETKKFLEQALKIGAMEIIPQGRPLKSGRISPYFFNSGLFITGASLDVLLHAYWTAWDNHPVLSEQEVDVVFGPAYKGIPLAVGLALHVTYEDGGKHLEYAFDRKEEKDHGEGGLLVGATLTGKQVLIVDDVMTSGGSCAEAVEFVRAHGGTPVGVLIAFDRQERGENDGFSAVQQFEQRFAIPVAAAATLNDLLEYMRRVAHSAVPLIEDYRLEYGVFPNDSSRVLPLGPTVGRPGTSFSDSNPIDEDRNGYLLPG